MMNELIDILQNIRSTVNIKHGLKAIILPIMLQYLMFSSWALADDSLDPVFIETLIHQAKNMELEKQQAWHDLLHYKVHIFGGAYSQVDDDDFFMSKQGKYDAGAELAATIESFFSSKAQQHPQCLFPARLHWLNKQLAFSSHLPKVQCPKLNSWLQKVDAKSVTMLFPSMYLHNPGSMFGHTFLRFNKKHNSDLLNYTLSYAAEHDVSDSMFMFVYKGISGGYTGTFSVQPYYETVQTYGDIEQRDIWEYALNLNQHEVDQMMRHIWEVSNLEFDYYFFRENCSYRLLSLLDVARPGLNLTRDFHHFHAIPVDTVRSTRHVGLIVNEKYRPAQNERIEQMFEQMSADSQKKTLEISRSNNTDFNMENISNIEKAKILETAHEITQLNEQQDTVAQKLLSERSHLKLDNTEKLFVYSNHRPDDGHDSARLQLAYGERENDNYIELGIRPAFHDLLDRGEGFVKGASITVMDTRVRWYESQQKLQLDKLSFFSMTALSPVKPWSRSLSGRLDLVVNREKINPLLDAKVFNIDTALGYTFEWGESLFYGFLDSQLSHSKRYAQHYIFSLGTELGALVSFDSSRMQYKSRFLYSVGGEDRDKEKHELFYQYDVGRNHGVRFGGSVVKDSVFLRERDVRVSYLMYF